MQHGDHEVIGLFRSDAPAEAAESALLEAGVARQHIRILRRQDVPDTAQESSSDANDDGLLQQLKNLLMPDDDRLAFAEGLRKGGAVVAVSTRNEHYGRVIDILDSNGAVDLDERSARWGDDKSLKHMLTADDADRGNDAEVSGSGSQCDSSDVPEERTKARSYAPDQNS